jgi:hypothetical protein
MGRSTGAGALSVWTHNLQDIEILDYDSGNYSGPALKAGAGVLGHDLQSAAHDEELFAVGGQCPVRISKLLNWWYCPIDVLLFSDCRLRWWVYTGWRTFLPFFQAWFGRGSSVGVERSHYGGRDPNCITYRKPRLILGVEWWSKCFYHIHIRLY